MKLRCQNCGHEFDGGFTKDSFGGHCVCPKCNTGFGVDVLEGRIIMAFAWDETDEYFTDDWNDDNKIATYYTFNAPGEFIKAWEKMVEDPDGMWYWVLDGEELVCSGACDPGDIDIFENYWGLQLKITDPDLNFVSDYDKMRDFKILTKDEFLNSYSYLTEEEYDATQLYLNWIREEESRTKEKEMNNDWIPVDSGQYPEDNKIVQVTYIGYNDGAPHCDAFAYKEDDQWYWSIDEEKVKVKIIAWKPSDKPYSPPQTASYKYKICVGVDGYLTLDVDAANLEEAKINALSKAETIVSNELGILEDVALRIASTTMIM